MEKFRSERSGDIQVFSPEEVWALVRAAGVRAGRGAVPDGGVHRAADGGAARAALARRRLRRHVDPRAGELLRRPADDAEVRQGPRGPAGARRRRALAPLGQREDWVGDDDLVFAGEAGGYLDGSALRRRYKAALARPVCARCASTICGTPSGRG